MTNIDPYLRRVEGIIAHHGHAVQYVGGDPDTGAPPFAYTVGLHTRPDRDYELALSGLRAETSHALLNTLTTALADCDSAAADGLEISGVLQEGLAIRLRPVSRPEDLGIIYAIYRTTPPVWQALWPDQRGHFPDDDRCLLPPQAQALL
ncbi:DUF4262 domain-containing protein [Streptomyces sp. NPDC059455]|uniref:DUF4262 domain-containing protein n=1 Tax=Streptomyces sp. NPDC059455 TaxID=3346837 RepID=UPI0036CD4D04